jgi:nucleoside-diphosphate-sugar epimerase
MGSPQSLRLPPIQTESQLEEALSVPYPEDIEAARGWGGDLLIIGAGGKMGPSLARRARRSSEGRGRVIAVSRYSDKAARAQLEDSGVATISADLLAPGAIDALPDAPNIIYMAARKFGTGQDAASTWTTNSFLPGLVARRYPKSRIVAFSTGNVYPLTPVSSGGPDESSGTGPVGEYAQSALARERVFEFFSASQGTPLALLRLNYAVELRYGVLADLAAKVAAGEPVDLSMGYVNVIWQGDANSVCLRCFSHCASPPFVLNLTGAEVLRVRDLAEGLGHRLGVRPRFTGVEAETALLSNPARCTALFGAPRIAVDQVMDWIAHWVQTGGRQLGKPTHFEVRDGRF